MTEVDPRFIQNPVRLSDSKIWEIQKNYFFTMGVDAWKEEVPFYISSNAFIGHRYASLVFHFIKDYIEKFPQSVHEPFYIIELGAGTGKFSFHFLNALNELLALDKSTLSFSYVITDIIQKNLDFCEKNPSLQPFIEASQLDFSAFDMEKDTDFYLTRKQCNYSELKSKNPLIIITNYVFDCIKQDAFEYEKGTFKEVKLGLTSRYRNYNIQDAKHLDDLKLKFESSEVKVDDYYKNPTLNAILKDYALTLKDQEANFTIPLSGIQFLDNIKALTKNNFFMISGDKGVSVAEKIPLLSKEYRATYDGCYSFIVNFDAMGSYLKKNGGDYYPSKNSNHFKVNLFAEGFFFADLPRTRLAFAELESLGPDEYCYIYDEFLTNGYRFALKALFSFLRLSKWDPNAYGAIHERVLELMPTAEKQLSSDIPQDLIKVQNNIYHINFGPDIYLLLGLFYQTQMKEDEALSQYQKSLAVFGDTAATHNNMAIIYEKKKNFGNALSHYQKSVALDKNNLFAKRKVLKLSGKPYIAMIMPLLKGTFVVAVLSAIIYFTFSLKP